MSISLCVQYLCNALVSLSFPTLQRQLGTPATMCAYAAVMFASWFFIFAFVPETKGLSLEDIQRLSDKNKVAVQRDLVSEYSFKDE